MNYTRSKKNDYNSKPWIKSYAPGVPAEVNFEEICIPELLKRSADKYPDLMALNFMGCNITFSQLNEMTDRFATVLAKFNIKKGDSVAIILPNTIQCVVAYYAILRIGAIAVMNNPLYSDREIQYQLNDSGSKILITIDILANRMIDLRPKTSIKQIIVASISDYLPAPLRMIFPFIGKIKGLVADVKKSDKIFWFKDLINNTQPEPPAVRLKFTDIAQYQYTGGTTGVAKGVLLSHQNLCVELQLVEAWFPNLSRGKEIMLGALPFFHVFGLTISMNFGIYMGWGNILIPKPQPDQLFKAFMKYKPTFLPMVPTMYVGLLNHPHINRLELKNIAGCFSGSASLPVEVIKQFEEKAGVVICEGFGMTESSPVTHINPIVKGGTKPGSIGLPLPNTECRIVDIKDGKTDVPIGSSGELLIRGPQVMSEYKGMEKETKNTLRNGWLHTGDIAVMDKDGYFSIIDRLKDMVITGGYNVYPREIDEILYLHPKVSEACAVGIPHKTLGEVIKVFVVLKDGEISSQEEIINFCRGYLARYKIPREVEFRKFLSKSAIGKVLRNELKAEELSKKLNK